MSDVQKNKEANQKSLPLFFSVAFKVIFIIVVISSILLYLTFTFEEVPPILNRGIQPSMIQLMDEIKSLGDFKININLHSEVQAQIKIKVIPAEVIQ